MRKYRDVLLVVSFIILGVASSYIYYNYEKKVNLKDNNDVDIKEEISLDNLLNNIEDTIEEESNSINEEEANSKNVNEQVINDNTKNVQSNISQKSDNSTGNTNKNSKKVNETTNTTNDNSNNLNNNQSNNSNINNQENNTSNEKQTENSSEKKEDTTKNEDTEKSVTIEYEVPSKTSIEDDAEYKKLMKEIYATSSECDKRGDAILDTDYVNISSYKCETQSYKGAIVGYRLKVRYSDGTWKEFKKNS